MAEHFRNWKNLTLAQLRFYICQNSFQSHLGSRCQTSQQSASQAYLYSQETSLNFVFCINSRSWYFMTQKFVPLILFAEHTFWLSTLLHFDKFSFFYFHNMFFFANYQLIAMKAGCYPKRNQNWDLWSKLSDLDFPWALIDVCTTSNLATGPNPI